MDLIITEPTAAYDLSAIAVGNVLWAKHSSWSEGIAGFVSSVTERQIIVQFHPAIGNVTNHYFIPVNEATTGDWQIRWSADLSEVYEYNTEGEDSENSTIDNSTEEAAGTETE